MRQIYPAVRFHDHLQSRFLPYNFADLDRRRFDIQRQPLDRQGFPGDYIQKFHPVCNRQLINCDIALKTKQRTLGMNPGEVQGSAQIQRSVLNIDIEKPVKVGLKRPDTDLF